MAATTLWLSVSLLVLAAVVGAADVESEETPAELELRRLIQLVRPVMAIFGSRKRRSVDDDVIDDGDQSRPRNLNSRDGYGESYAGSSYGGGGYGGGEGYGGGGGYCCSNKKAALLPLLALLALSLLLLYLLALATTTTTAAPTTAASNRFKRRTDDPDVVDIGKRVASSRSIESWLPPMGPRPIGTLPLIASGRT